MSHTIASLLNKRKNPLHLSPKERTRQNLEYVVEHLPILADLMPEIRRDFNMGNFGCYENSVRECGTAGCLMGNISRLFEIEPYILGDCYDYHFFTIRVFPYISGSGSILNWSFLFDADWEHYQPTFDQAIDRIKHLLSCDLEIDDFIFHPDIITS